MTRINCIPVEELRQQHLVAEYRELPRVFTLARKAYDRGDRPKQDRYVLGAGHVKFFYTRLKWLRGRFRELHGEMINRGYNPTIPVDCGDHTKDLPPGWNLDWTPSEYSRRINRERIETRLAEAARRKALRSL